MLVRIRSVDDAIVARLASSLRLRQATARCLAVRGVREPDEAKGFIDPRLAALRPPAGLAGMSTAVERIAHAVVRGERIGVFGDYDVDGITTAALLTSFLRACGAAVEAAVARRDAGYGFTAAAADDFADRGCTLIITGDCGTSDLAAIAQARARGVEVIVVDHHTVPQATEHPAFALVNPHRADSTFPFRGMASVGLGFYVAAAVRTELRDRGHFRQRGVAEPDVRELLDFVALGTIADLVPLAAENRILTALGLRKLNGGLRPGIAAMLQLAGVDREVDARTVAWKLAPRINAPGRLGAAEPALSLLLADADTAAERAQALEAANAERRTVQDQVMTDALERIERTRAAEGTSAIVVSGEGWPPGVVGIVAAKLVDLYQRPAFVVAVDPATGLGRGSARSCGGVNLYDALATAAGCLDRFGGHAAAAGFTVQRSALAALDAELRAACEAQGSAVRFAEGSGRINARDIDAEVRLADVDERLAEELAGLGPFGQENAAPVLVARGSKITALRRVGDGSHLKLTLEDGHTSRTAIGFGLGNRELDVGAEVVVAFLPTISTWQGRRSAELELADVAPSV